MRERILAAAAIAAAWASTLLTPAVERWFGWQIATGPDLPYLLSRSPETDVRSSALALLIVVGVAVFGAFIADLGKMGQTQRWRVPAIFVFQLVLVADNVRAYARDWWTYFAVVLQHRYPELYEPTPLSAVRWPWISCLLAVLLIIAIIGFRRPTA